MAGINKVILVGNVGRDPQTYEFEGGNKKVSFSMATTESYRDREGNWQDQTEWHNVAGYGYLAEKTMAKGDMVYVEGKLKTRKYTDKEGVEKYFTEVVADKINILVRRNAEGYQSSGVGYSQNPESELTTHPDQKTTESSTNETKADDGDLPF